MERVQGIGGVFLRAKDRAALAKWYGDHLGLKIEDWFGAVIPWADQDGADKAMTVWSAFAPETDYFGDAGQQVMINFRVKDLHAMLAQLRGGGVEVLDKVEESEFGRFGWVVDCEGNRIELWEPPS